MIPYTPEPEASQSDHSIAPFFSLGRFCQFHAQDEQFFTDASTSASWYSVAADSPVPRIGTFAPSDDTHTNVVLAITGSTTACVDASICSTQIFISTAPS